MRESSQRRASRVVHTTKKERERQYRSHESARPYVRDARHDVLDEALSEWGLYFEDFTNGGWDGK